MGYQAVVVVAVLVTVWFFLWLVVPFLCKKKYQKESENEKVSKGI